MAENILSRILMSLGKVSLKIQHLRRLRRNGSPERLMSQLVIS